MQAIMPIQVFSQIKALSQPEFNVIDKEVMRLLFGIHNELGRFLDEKVYKRALAERSAASGLKAECEVRIRLTHDEPGINNAQERAP
jgi:hypothetical protein